uniref:hypothetical protein n=1 Tax=Mycobacterium marinum TaxID=1781 RepID=UPI003567E712
VSGKVSGVLDGFLQNLTDLLGSQRRLSGIGRPTRGPDPVSTIQQDSLVAFAPGRELLEITDFRAFGDQLVVIEKVRTSWTWSPTNRNSSAVNSERPSGNVFNRGTMQVAEPMHPSMTASALRPPPSASSACRAVVVSSNAISLHRCHFALRAV